MSEGGWEEVEEGTREGGCGGGGKTRRTCKGVEIREEDRSK